jgi:hypothetical protein
MKKSLLAILILLPLFVKAQYSTQINTNTTPQYIYVGTLNFLSSDASNLQKIQVDIFGGGWDSPGLGITTYYIANRGGLVVNQVRMGSSNENLFTLQAYTNGSNNNIDFYLVTNYWCALGIKSIMLGSSTTPVNQYIPITSSTSAPSGGIPLTLNIVPVMITDATGNISIGTLNPNGYKLAVKGNVHAQQVNVNLNNWADYVFNKDYQLLPLHEVKTYIDQNHHLPDMPSAQEVIKDGLNLGEMNKLLTKKVEELTLYLIEKDKQLKEDEMKLDRQVQYNQQQDARIGKLEKELELTLKNINNNK